MAGKGEGEGEGNLAKLENQIVIMKYMMLFTNMVIWVSKNYLKIVQLSQNIQNIILFCKTLSSFPYF